MLKYQLDDVSASELETQGNEKLPDRAAMSLVNANLNLAPAGGEECGLPPSSSCARARRCSGRAPPGPGASDLL